MTTGGTTGLSGSGTTGTTTAGSTGSSTGGTGGTTAGASGGCEPVAALNPSHPASDACGIDHVLAEDGLVAGLINNGLSTLDGQSVSGCVAADFGSAFPLDPVVIRAQPLQSVCGASCIQPYCGTADDMLVFMGTSQGSYSFVATVHLTSSALSDYPVTIGTPARYVVVCRGGAGNGRDNLGIDVIRAGGCSASNCPSPYAVCGAGCTHTASDPNNCNGCGQACQPGEICASSACADGGMDADGGCPPADLCAGVCCLGGTCVNGSCHMP